MHIVKGLSYLITCKDIEKEPLEEKEVENNSKYQELYFFGGEDNPEKDYILLETLLQEYGPCAETYTRELSWMIEKLSYCPNQEDDILVLILPSATVSEEVVEMIRKYAVLKILR